MNSQCPNCGQDNSRVERGTRKGRYLDTSFSYSAEHQVCNACGEEFVGATLQQRNWNSMVAARARAARWALWSGVYLERLQEDLERFHRELISNKPAMEDGFVEEFANALAAVVSLHADIEALRWRLLDLSAGDDAGVSLRNAEDVEEFLSGR